MADLLPNKLLHFSFSSPRFPRFPPISFPLSRSPQAHFSIIRLAPLRRSRLCYSSSVLANLRSDSTQLEIISTAEQSDGSVVFKFGDSSEKSQSFENLNASDTDTKSEVLGAVDEEYGLNHTKSELVENADGEHELKFERKSVNDREFPEVHKNDGAEMVSSTDNKKDENHSSEIVHSLDSKVDENSGSEEEGSTISKVKLKETVLNSITQAGELVGSPGSPTDLQTGAQSYGDYIEDQRNHNLISTVELENPSDSKMAKRDVGTNVLSTISDSSVDLVRENSNESGMAKRDGGSDTLVTTSDSPANSIMEKFEETDNGELVAAVSAPQLGLEGGKLLEISEKSSGVKTSERPVSLEDNGIGSNVKHVPNEEGDDMLEIAETNSPIEASDLAVSLENNELDISVNQVVNEEDADNKFQVLVGVNSLIEASEKAVSLEDDELDSDVKQAAIEEDDDNKLQGIVDMNSVIEISDTALSLEDDKLDSSPRQVADVENVENKLRDIANVDSLVETSYMALSLEDDELKSNQKQMATEEDDDRKLQESTDVNSFAETSKTAVSLEDDTLQSSMEQAANEEGGDNKLEEFAEMNSLGEAVSLEDSQLDSNEKHVMNEDDSWVEPMEKPAQLEAEPILDEDASSDSPDEVVASESTSGPNMVNDAVPAIIPQSHDDLRGLDHSEAGKPEASAIALEEANVDSVNSEQMAMPTLHLSSAAASLPHSSEALIGGKDAYFICQNWFGVADGVGQWSFRGTNRGMYAQELMQNCENLVLNSRSAGLTNIKEVLQQISAATESTGSARVLVAHFDNRVLHVANIGDTGFVIIRNGAIFKKSSPMVHEFSFPYAIGAGVDPLEAVEEYYIELQDGDVIVAATDGLFDNLYDQEIVSIVSKSVGAEMEPKEVAELLATKAQEVGSSAYGRTPFSDAAQAAGHIGVIGGKLDHVTVVVSLVQSR